MTYNYSLEKSSKKHTCPQCNKKRYVRFVQTENNAYLSYQFGRCDRESSCGYFMKPTDCEIVRKPAFQAPPLQAESYIASSIVKASLKNYSNNNLYLYLSNYFNRSVVDNIFKKYHVGTSKKWNGATVFWQKDLKNSYKTGKIMLYNTITGKRVKHPYNHISWAHKALKIPDFNLKQCLFGMHLVTNTTKLIGLVESEKTALTMSLFLPEYTWIATGSKQNLKESLLNSIKRHKIVLYPDKGEFNDWNTTSSTLSEIGFDITCSNYIEKSTIKQGSDLADIYFDLQNKNTDNMVLSQPEKIVKQLIKSNPDIKLLIDTFDLVDEGGNSLSI